MVCRTPGSSEVGPLSISRDNLDLRDLNDTYASPVLRLVSVEDDCISATEETLAVVTSYEAWQYLPREAREQRVELARQRRAIAQRKRAKRTEKAIFHSAAALACVAALVSGVHLIGASHNTPHALTKVTVAPGDSLWTVASRYTPSGSATINTVGLIRTANPKLAHESHLRVGQQIFVPTANG